MNPYAYPGIKCDISPWYKKLNIPLTDLQAYVDEAFEKTENTRRMQAYSRMLFFYLARKYTMFTLSQIAKPYKMSHCSVIHGSRQIDNYISINDPLLLPIIKKAEAQIFQRPIFINQNTNNMKK